MVFSFFKKSNDYKKYLIVSAPRSGSTMLSKALLAHPQVVGKGEYFARLGEESPQVLLSKLFCPKPHRVKAVGFNIHYNHPETGNKEMVWKELQNIPELHIIHLKRLNILRYLVSSRIAQKLKLYRIKSERYRPTLEERKITVSIDDLQRALKQIPRRASAIDKQFDGHPRLDLSYEGLSNDLSTELQRVTSFLELEEFVPPQVTTVMNPESLEDLIVNYRELKEAFSASEFEWMFSD